MAPSWVSESPAPTSSSGFFGWVKKLFGGPAPAPVPAPAVVVVAAPVAPTEPAADKREGKAGEARRNERGGRGERGDRGGRGRDGKSGARPGRKVAGVKVELKAAATTVVMAAALSAAPKLKAWPVHWPRPAPPTPRAVRRDRSVSRDRRN